MLDIPALPIAFALTLWDAAPIYVSIGLALAVIWRATTQGQSFHSGWALREKLAAEGTVYLLIFQPLLAPVMILVGIGQSIIARRAHVEDSNPPSTPVGAMRTRGSELISALLLGSLVAAVIKITAPSLPEHLAFQIVLAAIVGAGLGSKPTSVAIPAVAIAVHTGGAVPAVICMLATLLWPAFVEIRKSAPAPTRSA
jgi:hypothetical protein